MLRHLDPARPSVGMRRAIQLAALGMLSVAIPASTGLAATTTPPSAPANNVAGDVAAIEAAANDFAQCVRDHGIANFPDPVVEGDGSFFFEDMADLGVSDEDLQAAQEPCTVILDAVLPPAPASAEPFQPVAAGWEQIVPGGDCACADGSEFSFWARAASTDKVVLFLDGGGVCFSAESCAPDSSNEYQTEVDEPNGEGVFAFGEARNPFADYSMVFVPYCTGDLFLGDATAEYTPSLTVQHKGYVNGTVALDYLVTTFPDASEVVLIGSSAGSTSAPLYGALVAEQLPDARVTVIADASGSYPDTPEINELLTAGSWSASATFSEWLVDRSLPGLTIDSGRRHPEITFAQVNHARDEDQVEHLELVGLPSDDVVGLIDANQAAIEATGVEVHAYTAAGDNHVILDNDSFYTATVDGVALVDWVTDLVSGTAVADVHCTDC